MQFPAVSRVATKPIITILMYHQIGRYPRPRTHQASFCHIRRFRQQMAYLKLMGFRVISLQYATKVLFHGAPLRERSVVLTFDDGYQDFYDNAWQELQKYNYPATVFLISGMIGSMAKWQTDFTEMAPLMNKPTILELRDQGVNFGSHTVNHPRLSQLDEKDARREIFDSKAALEDLLGKEVSDFCYPYGKYNPRVRDIVGEAGYRTGLTCVRGAANAAENPLEIPRKAIAYSTGIISLTRRLFFKHERKGV